MKVSISHIEGMKFEAKAEKGSFIINCPEISPIEYFLAGIISCTASDMAQLPKNQGKNISNLVVDGDAARNDNFPKKFNELHLVYSFDSDADDVMASRWVMASIETYCSTINTIRDNTAIYYTIKHNGKIIKDREKIISGGGSKIDLGELDSCCSS